MFCDNAESLSTADLEQLCTRCERCFNEGVSAFESVGDVVNMALLHSNRGKLMRLRAQSVASALVSAKKREFTNVERNLFLQVGSVLTELIVTATAIQHCYCSTGFFIYFLIFFQILLCVMLVQQTDAASGHFLLCSVPSETAVASCIVIIFVY